MRLFFRFLTTDVIFDLAFGGRGPQLLKAGEDTDGMFGTMLSALRAFAAINHVPALIPLVKLLPPNPKIEQFMKLCNRCYLERIEDPSPSHDIFRHLVC